MPNSTGIYNGFLKVLTGWLSGLLLLLLSLPLQVFIAFILLFYNKGKIFFRQRRIGYKEKIFVIYKFRTLSELYDINGNLLADEQRQTIFGNILRHLHLDELPQLWNVVLGQLQIIGPRPLLPEYIPFYTPQQRVRHLSKPGITGLSQVKGGNALSWRHRLRYDRFYVEHASFKLDVYILWLSVKYLLQKKNNISAGNTLFSESFIDYTRRTAVS